MLDTLANSNPRKLFYVTKTIETYSARFKNSTPSDIAYETMDGFLNGEGIEKSEKKAAERFIKTCGLDMETLKLKAVVKDATFYNFIQLKGDGMLYHSTTASMLGRNVSDVVEALKNPLNDEVLGLLLNEVEEYWNQ
jgi:glycyl-tRNA synthetase beta subunit